MSTLGDQIQTAIDEFTAKSDGDDWRSTQENTFLPSLQSALNDAVSETSFSNHSGTTDAHHTKTTDTHVDALSGGTSVNTDVTTLNFIGNTQATYDSTDDRVDVDSTDTDTQPVASGTSVIASGDGTATTFSLSHSLGTTPSQAVPKATSSAANDLFYVSAMSSTSVDVTYSTAPPSGTDNLSWHLILIE